MSKLMPDQQFGNLTTVRTHINMMKRDLPEEEFLNLCKLVANGACER